MRKALEPARVREVGEPSREATARHEHTHLLYGRWSQFCVMGRGRQEGHVRQLRRGLGEGIPKVSVDYGFPASEDQHSSRLEGHSRMRFAAVVPRTGSTGQTAARIIAFLLQLCADRTDVVIKSDAEAAMKAVADDVAALRPWARTMREEALRGSSGSNGIGSSRGPFSR